MKHDYEGINEHIQWLIKFMQEKYPNCFFELTINSFGVELTINSNGANIIHSTPKAMNSLDENVMKEKDPLPID